MSAAAFCGVLPLLLPARNYGGRPLFTGFCIATPTPALSNPSEIPAILLRLRHETHPYHDALEQHAFNRAMAAGTPTAAGTAQFLTKMYGFLQPYETVLRAHTADFSPAWTLTERFRAHLILEDLPAIAGAPIPPLCPAMPPLRTRAQLLGTMYVMEGSTLGGQVIARQLAKAGIPMRQYFMGYGGRTGALWKTFCQQLAEAAPAAGPDEVVAAAGRAFHHLDAWLNQP